jgi:hypothetical protein
MNPNIDKFPTPDTGLTGANMQGGEFSTSSLGVEQLPSKEAASFTPPQPTMPTAPTIAQPALVAQTAPVPVANSAQLVPNTLATGAEEEIEKKWVAIARDIVERTKGDPYAQSQQLTKAGIEYRAQSGRGVNPGKE